MILFMILDLDQFHGYNSKSLDFHDMLYLAMSGPNEQMFKSWE